MAKLFDCRDFESVAMLYAASELAESERAAVEQHVRECPLCAALLDREIALRKAVTSRGDAAETLDRSGLLLARCRSELAEALDDAENQAARPGLKILLSPWRWGVATGRALEFHSAWSAAILLVIGALGGLGVHTWIHENSLPLPAVPAITVSAAARLTDQEMETMGVEGVQVEEQDSASPHVEIQIFSSRPITMQGTIDDVDVRRVLTYVVAHPQRFSSGVRLDSLDALRTRVSDSDIRHALCQAARHDANPAVRLKALEALNGMNSDPDALHTMVAALSSDENSGVRVEAVNSLLAALGSSDAGPVPVDFGAQDVLRDRMQNDPNHYIRQRSATALARLASLESGPADAGRIRP
jgi:hypothetical protein